MRNKRRIEYLKGLQKEIRCCLEVNKIDYQQFRLTAPIPPQKVDELMREDVATLSIDRELLRSLMHQTGNGLSFWSSHARRMFRAVRDFYPNYV